MTDFWQLEFHYDRDDHSCDDLFLADEALLHWWTERLDLVERAFAGHAQQNMVSLPEPKAVMIRWKRAERRSSAT